MTNIAEAEKLLQRAYNLDVDKREEQIDIPALLNDLGIQTVHIAYYDSGLAQHDEIRQHLREYPNGVLMEVITTMRDARVKMGEYSKETLDLMYGLTEYT